MNELIKKVEATIKTEHLIDEGDKIVLGVSGGADSMALLSVLAAFQKSMQLQLIVVHIHHGLRGIEADGDRDFVEAICKKYALPFICYETDIRAMAREHHVSEEEAGRMFRYDCFERVLKKYQADKIAVAHHMDDTAETVLMNLFRGSGLKGLSGIPPKRGVIVRPLIRVSRRQIEDYLESEHLEYRTDATNFETNYTRNKVRLELLPYARKNINSAAVEHIAETAALASDIEDYIKQQADAALGQCAIFKEGICRINVERFLSFHVTIQREMLRSCLANMAGQLKDISMMNIESFRELFSGDSGRKISLPYGIYAVKNYDNVEMRVYASLETQMKQPINHSMEVLRSDDLNQDFLVDLHMDIADLKSGTEQIKLNLKVMDFVADKNMQIPKKLYTKWFDYDKIKGTLIFRCREEGDYMMIGGEHKKSLRRILMDSHIPKDNRDTMLFLAEGNHILWMPDTGRTSEYYKVTEQTKRVLIADLEK